MRFDHLIAASLRQRALVLVAAAVLAALGLQQALHLPVDVLPDLTRPTVVVQTEAPGLSTEDVESQVSYPLETALGGVQDLARLRSVSVPGLSIATLEFNWDADAYRSRQLVAERIDALRGQLPDGSLPRLLPQTSLMGEILLVALRADRDDVSPSELREVADWTLRPRLLALPGAAQVVTIGGSVRQYEIHPDPARMRLQGVSLAEIEQAASAFGSDRGGGLLDAGGAEFSVRSLGRPFALEDLAQAAVGWRTTGDGGVPVRLGQVADLATGSRFKRGDAGTDGRPAVILSIQKQPGADTLALTAAAERVLRASDSALPAGVSRSTVFRQADFIEASVHNVREALLQGAVIVALVLGLFLAGGRATAVSLLAIPLSLLGAVLVFRLFGLSINTMTLGGLAIAVGELVDDAVIGVENVARRLRERSALTSVDTVVAAATAEVRGGVIYATALIVLACLPLFALPGVEGRLFLPLALAYIVSILASLLVALTVTPVLCSLAFRGQARLPHERRWVSALKTRYARLLTAVLAHPQRMLLPLLVLAGLALLAGAQVPRSFLPAFNESALTVNLLLTPGVSLEESDRIGRSAESIIAALPDVAGVGRRSGRAELDEHAEGVWYSEMDVQLKPGARSRTQVVNDLRGRLASLPATLVFGTPIAHRVDHLLSGVRAPFVAKFFGDDLGTLRELAQAAATRLRAIPGLAEVQVERQAMTAQVQVRVDARRAAQFGVSPPRVQDALLTLAAGRPLGRIIEGERRLDLVLRTPQESLSPEGIGALAIDTPAGPVPLRWLGEVKSAQGPNQIVREDLQRRIAVTAYAADARFDAAAVQAGAVLDAMPLPPGYTLKVEGQALARQQASARILQLGAVALLLMAGLLYSRYQSVALAAIVLLNVPLALAGGIIALWLSGTPLSVAGMVGFVTLAGIAARNGILKISHYRNLAAGERLDLHALVIRGSCERLTPVLMTAGIAATALAPLLFDADAPGKEILHPVAVVIFGGLLSGTAVDSFLTPLLFAVRARRLAGLATHPSESFAAANTHVSP